MSTQSLGFSLFTVPKQIHFCATLGEMPQPDLGSSPKTVNLQHRLSEGKKPESCSQPVSRIPLLQSVGNNKAGETMSSPSL